MITRRGTFYSHMSGAGSDLMHLVSILPLSLYPVVGLVITSGIEAVATARSLHKPYFQSKKMTPHEIAVSMKERKPEIFLTVFAKISDLMRAVLAFGFSAALLRSTPLIGIFFTISNRIGACMWAFGTSSYSAQGYIYLRSTLGFPRADLEKRQQCFRSGELKPVSLHQNLWSWPS